MPEIKRGTAAIVLLFEVVFSLISASCTTNSKAVGCYNCSELNVTVHKILLREDDFVNYDLDKQYAIYICGMQYIHPPMMGLAVLFAREGSKVIDFLKTKLVEANDDLTIRDLVLILNYMSGFKTYNVANDEELMHIICERVEGMKDRGWRESARQMVTEIKK